MLVVDDNKVIRQLIRVNLELEGLEVVTAADGAECLDVVHQVRPDVVTLDVVMPRLDGLRTAARLRSDPRTRDLPLAIVSACTQYEVETGLDVGVDAFLAKPFEPGELVRLVRQLIERKQGVVLAEGPMAGPMEGPLGRTMERPMGRLIDGRIDGPIEAPIEVPKERPAPGGTVFGSVLGAGEAERAGRTGG